MNQSENTDKWKTRSGFILAVVGSAVGLGNIWRFSYVVYDNGGGAFLIPYFIALFIIGIPLLLMEFSFGQKLRGSAALSFRRFSKKWEWMGWWPVMTVYALAIYYSAIIGWSLNYFFYSFGQKWGSNPESFFYNSHLGLTSGAGQLGGIRWKIFLTVLAIWLIIYVIIYNGIKKGIEKASKLFVPLLGVLMLIITIRGITLPGAVAGLDKYLSPDFSQLTNWKVWMAAFGQIFFTMSVGFGVMITYASYQDKDSDIVNNTFIAGFANSGFSLIVGLGVFGILGYMAGQTGQAVDNVVAQSMGLAFVAFPKAINMLPALKNVFGILFFGSLVIAGLSSIISMIEAVVANIQDKFSVSRGKSTTIICAVGFLGSILFTTGAGLYLLDIFDHFNMEFGPGVAALIMALVLGWKFDAENLRHYANTRSDFPIGRWWNVMVKFVSPAVLLIMFIRNLITELTTKYAGYPMSSLKFGWILVIATVVIGVIFSKFSWQDENLIDNYDDQEVDL